MMKKRILVVDDDPTFRTVLQMLLEDYGHIGEAAANAQEALTRLAQTDYDAVLLDYMMPEANGLTVLQHIQERHPSTPVVMITGHATSELAAQVLAAGARACLFKPFDCREFEQILTSCVGTAA